MMLDLETDLPVGADDVNRLNALHFQPDLTLAEYIEFLETIGAFSTRKPDPVIFNDIFEL
ncbi:MAG: hypothetical protein SWH68_15180 [Thermodesulfobacteriota bacterium]|nr:hypothetical protein [Thermodesulfobacteriota bacterium]